MSIIATATDETVLAEGFQEPVPEEEIEEVGQEQEESAEVTEEPSSTEETISVPLSKYERLVALEGQHNQLTTALSAKEQADRRAEQEARRTQQVEQSRRQMSAQDEEIMTLGLAAAEFMEEAAALPAGDPRRKSLYARAEGARQAALEKTMIRHQAQAVQQTREQIAQEMAVEDMRTAYRQIEYDLTQGEYKAFQGYLPEIQRLIGQFGMHPKEAATLVLRGPAIEAHYAQTGQGQQQAAEQTRRQKASLPPSGGNGPSAGGTGRRTGQVDLRAVSPREAEKLIKDYWDAHDM